MISTRWLEKRKPYWIRLEQLLEGQGEEYDEILTWLGGDFDPDGFDRNLINRRLRQLG